MHHRRRELDAAVRAQLDRIAHSTLLGLAHPPAIELAERLVKVAPPGLEHVFYSDSGSTAVEVALKLALQFHQLGGDTKRQRFLALRDAYHGDTLGAVSVGGIDLFHRLFAPITFHTERAEATHAALKAAFAAHGPSLCALVMEPLIQGAAGMRVHPEGLLRLARELCDRHGVLLIADEVATGFGRTGTLFACEHEGVAPDLLCVAKGLTGGYLPLAATLATEAIYGRFLGTRSEQRHFFHGHTYTGNPLACAAALASLDVFERDLSELQALLALPAGARKGRARWLLDENTFLASALRTRWRRQDRAWFHEADGLVAPNELVRAELAAFFLEDLLLPQQAGTPRPSDAATE